ncbi:hypothetical protein [uncultured Litoreibacter sp.]|uniref:hypothetical protein n=1 Tax=uncultured Litoreibacter sp. TaxID=1392394 RepID=UPI00261403D6|nr:hypothetical protein [uncultured Litoreibacter sp.]
MILRWLADRGPWVLVAGIVAGLLLPSVAAVLVPYIPHMVAGLLFLSALRIGPQRMRASMKGNMFGTLRVLLLLQLAFPLLVIAVLYAFGWLGSPFALAFVIIAMASSISGAPNMVAMMGFEPSTSMRFLLIGTAILPVTVIPVLWLMPALGGFTEVILAALRLLVVIGLSSAFAFLIRGVLWKEPSADELKAVDGASALLLAVIVVGLMSAVNAALVNEPSRFWLWLGFVLAVNFGLQFLAFAVLRRGPDVDRVAALTVMAGNRNIALFLVALPEQVMAPLLIFVGCYQIPMYLTPLVTGRVLKTLDEGSA